MKRVLAGLFVAGVLATAVAFSGSQTPASKELAAPLRIDTADRNPWTHLRLNNDSDNFQFVIVSDRTGGHREKIFSKAVEQINLLQPEFVMSVGDLIEGYTVDLERLHREWKEFQTFTSRLEMPFFYVPGNHDITNKIQDDLWKEKFGRRYYHFVYKNVLFLVLHSDDPPGSSSMSNEQVEYAKKVLAENPNVSWTMVFFHKPIWLGNIEKNGWGEIEKALNGRNYTVFVGHVHRYQKYVRNGMNYYQLATTGGGSRLRGARYGEFDHIVWVTMKKTGPVLANIMLDGILPENLKLPDTDEPVTQYDRRPTYPVKGFVYYEGTPAAGATIAFHLPHPITKRMIYAGDAIVEGDGSFVMSTYSAFDGAPAGEYIVTVVNAGKFIDEDSKPTKNLLPARYASTGTSPLRALVKPGPNEFVFELQP